MFYDSKEKKAYINSANIGAYVEISGLKMHYIEAGEGEPVVLVHGVGQSLFTWHQNFSELAKNYHVFALDLLGYGYSDCPDLDYSIEDNVKMIGAFMDALGIRKAHLVGFSSGAVYVMDYLLTHGERVDKAVLISPGGMTRRHPFFVRMLDNSALNRFFVNFLNANMVEKLLSQCFFDQTCVTDTVIDQYFLPLARTQTRYALTRSIINFDDENTLENMRAITHNVLLLWGEDDNWHPIEMAEAFHAALPNASLVPVRNCGHMLHEEKGERFNEIVDEFFKWDPNS